MKTKKKSEFAKLPAGDKVLMTICYIILGLFLVAIILPVIYIILASFIDPITLQNKGLTFDFTKWTATAYQRVLSNAQIWVGFKSSLRSFPSSLRCLRPTRCPARTSRVRASSTRSLSLRCSSEAD